MTTATAGLIIPAQIKITQLAIAGRLQRRQQVRLHPRQQHLALRITEPHIELDQLGPLLSQHQAGEQNPAERHSLAHHFLQAPGG